MRLPILAAAALIGASFISVPASAAPLAGIAKELAQVQPGENALVQQVRHRRGPRGVPRRGRRGDGGAVAAGAILGLALGAIIATEAARQRQGVEYCLRRYRSYDPETGTWVDRYGRLRRCP